MKDIVKKIGLAFLAFAVALTAIAVSPVTTEAATTMVEKTSVSLKVDDESTISLKSKYAKKYYISKAEGSTSWNTVLDAGYNESSIVVKAIGPGTAKIRLTITNKSTGKSTTNTIKYTVKGSAKKSFDVTDINGKTKSIRKYYGKPMVINFWATWCGPCMGEMSEMKKAYDTYGKKVRFMFVNVWDASTSEVSSVKKTLEKKVGGKMPVYVESGSKASSVIGFDGIPCTIFVDKKGKILHKQVGSYASYDALVKDIKKYLL